MPLEDTILIGDRKMPTAENQLTWLRLNLGDIGPIPLQDHQRQTLRALLAAGQTWQAFPYVAQREAAKPPPASKTGSDDRPSAGGNASTGGPGGPDSGSDAMPGQSNAL